MACKLRCPRCGLVLKEEGDNGKVAQGEYGVIEHATYNEIICRPCGHIGNVRDFDDAFAHERRKR